MAKGQRRTNREIRKPKKEKKPPTVLLGSGFAGASALRATLSKTNSEKKKPNE